MTGSTDDAGLLFVWLTTKDVRQAMGAPLSA